MKKVVTDNPIRPSRDRAERSYVILGATGGVGATTDATRFESVANGVASLLLKPAHLTTVEEWEQVIKTRIAGQVIGVDNNGLATLRPRRKDQL